MKLNPTSQAESHRDLFYPPHPMPPSTPPSRHVPDDEDELVLAPWGVPDRDLARQTVTTFPPAAETVNIIRMYLSAYQSHDRVTMDLLLCPEFSYTSSLHHRIDRAAYFKHCWPASLHTTVNIERIFEKDSEAFVTYECQREDGSRFRNTAFFILQDERIRHLHVYSDSPDDLMPVETM